jgi:hypothetical protein
MSEADDVAWRAAVMQDQTLSMAERVEKVLRGRPRMSTNQARLVGMMNQLNQKPKDGKVEWRVLEGFKNLKP